MAQETRMNGQPVVLAACPQQDWSGWLQAIDAHAAERGWQVHEILCDGEPQPREVPAVVGEDTVLDVVAGPAEVNPQDFVQQIAALLPQFREAVQGHANLFSQGHWKSALETLTPLLDELSVAAEGLELGLGAVGRGELPRGKDYPQLLEELSANIQQQSWVEVSDLLLYELEPLLEEWESVALAVE
ncbi:MAG: hypothetical protein AAF581_05685 [Planctomycetota bacterium]